jgi:hypothetical protein
MMAPRPMALHPAGFWMYPTPGAAAQWPAMAYPHQWAPYAAAYGYYPFQVCIYGYLQRAVCN